MSKKRSKRHLENKKKISEIKATSLNDAIKAFNAKTQKEKPGMPIPCVVTVYKDKTFQIKVKKSPASHFLKEAANLTKSSRNPGREII